MSTQKQVFKFTPTIKGVAIFYGIILLDLGLVLTRKHPFQDPFFREVCSHISNFAITSIMVALMAFIMGLQGAPFKSVIWLGAVAIVLNFVVELFVPILNTPDVIDAFYGVAGVVLTCAIMYIFYKTGIRDLL